MMSKFNQKYFSKKATIDGITFDSKKEADRYLVLKQREQRGEISDLQLQVPFILIPAQYETVTEYTPKTHKDKKVQKLIEKKLTYIADFVYTENGKIIVEDVKGYKKSTAYAVFAIKRKLMLYFHGIRLREV